MSMKDLLVAALLSVFALSGCQSVKIGPATEQANDEGAASAVNEAEVRAIA
ncbi:MAG TPA: cell envelope protein, partial [Cupriavidus sp.]|nr:cell envelope protein [Cupriavidus sp.]